MDVCSPGEVEWALEHGWREDEISYTGTNLSERDLDVILAHPGVHLNVDLLSQIERVGRRAPGRTIGIRVNPRGGAGFDGRRSHALLGAAADEVRDLPRAARRRPRHRPDGTTSRSTPCISTSATGT